MAEFFLYLHSFIANFKGMKTRLAFILAFIIGMTACNKKEDPHEVTNTLVSDAVVFTEKHWSPLHNGDTIRLSFEEKARDADLFMRDSVYIDTSWFAKVFIDSTLIAQTDKLPWYTTYVVDLEPGQHELFAIGRIKMKEFSLHNIDIYVTE